MTLITALLFSFGCSGKDDGIEPSSEPIDTEDTEQNNDPVYEGPVYGAFLVDHQLADEPGDATTALYGVFVDSEQPYSNNLSSSNQS